MISSSHSESKSGAPQNESVPNEYVETKISQSGKQYYVAHIGNKIRIIERKTAVKLLKDEGHLKNYDYKFFNFKKVNQNKSTESSIEGDTSTEGNMSTEAITSTETSVSTEGILLTGITVSTENTATTEGTSSTGEIMSKERIASAEGIASTGEIMPTEGIEPIEVVTLKKGPISAERVIPTESTTVSRGATKDIPPIDFAASARFNTPPGGVTESDRSTKEDGSKVGDSVGARAESNTSSAKDTSRRTSCTSSSPLPTSQPSKKIFPSFNEKSSAKLSKEYEKRENACKNVAQHSQVIPYEAMFKSCLVKLQAFKSDTFQTEITSNEEIRSQLSNLLEKEDLTEFYIQVSQTKEMGMIFANKVAQELKMVPLQPQANVMKEFPPQIGSSLPSLTKLLLETAPNVAKTLMTIHCKPDEEVTEQQMRHILASFCHLSHLGERSLSTFPKILGLELKLCGLTHFGLDVMGELGFTQTSRMWRNDSEFLASVSMETLVRSLSLCPFCMCVDNVDKLCTGFLEHCFGRHHG